MSRAPVLIILGGLSGVGKSSIARELARQIGAIHVRIDSIEQALRNCGKLSGPMDDAGYRAAYTIAEKNLRAGRTVVADCVNSIQVTREAWREVGRRVRAKVLEVEIVCSDQVEHRRRVEDRQTDIPGLKLPTWQEVLNREYDAWDREHLIIDTANSNIDFAVTEIRVELRRRMSS